MPQTKRLYPPEFRQQMIELVHWDRSRDELAQEFEPTAPTIRNWVAQAARESGERTDGSTGAEAEALRRLRRENLQLREEREILAKAPTWFAGETNETSNGSSSSSR